MNTHRRTHLRQERIVELINEHGYLSVEDLGQACEVSVATIRRDLLELIHQGKIFRTHGGGISLSIKQELEPSSQPKNFPADLKNILLDRIDALILSIIDPQADLLFLDKFLRRKKPIIAESLPAPFETPVISVDDYQAGYAIGQWVGQYTQEHWNSKIHLLDLTYNLINTQARSKGFGDGLKSVLQHTEEVHSVNSQANVTSAYQLTLDALKVNPQINVIFAINDTSAYGAYKACQEMKLDSDQILIVPFGLEGDTVRNLMAQNQYIKAGVAMFPEIVGRTCLQAALMAISGKTVEKQLVTPFAVVTSDNLADFYCKTETGWALCWEKVHASYDLPIDLAHPPPLPEGNKPCIGFTVRFRSHEWYQNLVRVMQEEADRLGINLEIIDIDQTMTKELVQRRTEIARQAVKLVRSESVIFLDSGPISLFFARHLVNDMNLDSVRVITNSTEVLEIFQNCPNITVISSGGVLRRNKPTMVGPTAEASIQNFRADQFFLMVSGISTGFGLSHDDISEVSIKQTMMKGAREVILLADHTCFGQESFVHFSSLKSVHKIITDDVLQVSFRLELNRQGIEIIVAG